MTAFIGYTCTAPHKRLNYQTPVTRGQPTVSEDDILEQLKRLEQKLDAGLAIIIERIEAIERRRKPSNRTKAELVRTIRDFYQKYRCPCCESVVILDDRGSPLDIAQYDHWITKSKNKPHQMWIVCKTCNSRLETDSNFKQQSLNRFNSFQERREQRVRPLLDPSKNLSS